MKEGLHFYFGHYPDSTKGYLLSTDLNIINVNLDGGLFQEFFIPAREIKETFIRGSKKPFFHGIDSKPLEFTLSFAFENSFNKNTLNGRHQKLRELARWLNKPYYIPFGIVGDDRIFYVTPINDNELYHNGMQEGYVTIDFRCDAPWAYSKIKNRILNGLPDSSSLCEFNNNGDLDIFPEIWILKHTAGNFTIVNETIGQEFKFVNLLDNEQVYVHNEKQYIESNRPNIYRYDDFNNNYLKLIPGINRLNIYGASDVVIRYQEKLITI